MLKNWKKKMIASLLIFTMTFSNFALVGKAYAATFLDGIFGSKEQDAGDTGSSNVEFDAYFKTSQDSKTSKSVKSDIKNSDLLVGVDVKVKNSGYLKDAKILFGDGEELNFVIKDEIQVETQTDKVEGDSTTPSTEETVIGEDNDETTIGGDRKPEDNQTMRNPISEEVVVGTTGDEEENPISEDSIDNSDNTSVREDSIDNSNSIFVREDSVDNSINTSVKEDSIDNSDNMSVREDNNSDENENPIDVEDSTEVTDENSEKEYETKSLVEENKEIQSFESNQLNLVQLNADSEMNIEFPINYNYKKFVEESMISKTNKIKFEGVYINNDAEEIKVSKTIDLKLSWEDEREIKTSSEITKYIGFSQEGNDGIILQTLATVDSKTDNSSLPIKESKVEITVPEIDGIKPETVSVVAKSLAGITGKENDEVIFGTENWNYDSENNVITINVQNKSELVSTQNENDTLIDETAPIKEMYYSESGIDKYLITYIYKNVSIGERELTTKVSATLSEFGETKLVSENEETSNLSDEIGSIVTFTNETSTDTVSKGYTYLNYNNEENKYEIEIDNKLVFNVSYKDMVESLYYSDINNQYVSKSGEILEQEDLYYKTLTLNKDNFTEMLGEDGIVNIYVNGEILFTINKDTEVNENGMIEVKFDGDTVKSIQIETSKPINNGNLIFTAIRAYSNVSYDKDIYKNFDRITINTVGKAKYIYLNDLADIGISDLDVKLEDTKTEATLEIGQSSLSTLAMNNNVELKIELNNDDVKSDVYGNSKFQIKLPKYAEDVDVTDYNIVYGEGLELGEVKGFEYEGASYIDIDVIGKQRELSSGIVSNGTNIVLNANIKVDLFAPASEDSFELTYTNDDATNYENNLNAGRSVAIVSYSAPSGVVSVNSISGYDEEDNNKTITSVNQGKVQDAIEIYSDKKVVKSELTIMNNEQNDISDIAILGRIPFENVKDIVNGEDLGTTVNTKMVSKIVPDEMNEKSFIYYYSENGEATNDLNDSSNGWTDEIESLDNVKSFLIVPIDPEYRMENASKLRFTYEYEIPENLEHNNEIYGTFATYYTNNTDVATISEVSRADLVGLTTGEGPQFDFETTVNKEEIKEYEEFEITTIVKNTGKEKANDIVVTVPVPEYSSYVSDSCDKDEASSAVLNNQVQFKLNSLEVDDTVEFKVTVVAQGINKDLYTEHKTVRDKNGNIIEQNEDSEERSEVQIKVFSLLTATDLDTLLKSEEKTVTFEHAELRISIENAYTGGILYKGCDMPLNIDVKNLTNRELHNVVATLQVPNGFEYVNGSILGMVDGDPLIRDIKQAEYTESSRTVSWKIGDIPALANANLSLKLDVMDLEGGVTKADIYMSANVRAEGTSDYSSGSIKLVVGKPLLTITQTTSTTNTYVKEGDEIDYQFVVKNEGSVIAQSVSLVDYVPEGLIVKSISYETEGMTIKKAVSSNDQVTVGASIPAGDSLVVNVKAVASGLDGSGERSVTNKGSIEGVNISQINSNDITHIVESSGLNKSGIGEVSTGIASSSSSGALALGKTYKITGSAWLDKNRDGMRTDDEQLMKGIQATLVDSDNGVLKQTTTTNSKGEYTFSGVRNGNYIVIFDYDTVLYTVTVYQKENIAQNVNSDAITTKIEQDGKLRNGAVTGVVNVQDVSVSNIDIGLVEALKFDLSLDMGISKISTQTSSGTNTINYENSKLTKTEIAAKQVEGSSVYIEYTYTIKNEGETSGFAKKIADYVPEGMNFNSGMNQDWFSGNDGVLYNTSLANVELQPGETKTLKLVLSKELTNDNMGTVSNTAEIVEDYNIYGVSDLDSQPANKAQNEDDFARTDSYLSVKTGEVFIYTSVIITIIILIGVAIVVISMKIKDKKIAKGGV